MALINLNKNPSPTEIRWFGVMFAVFFGLIGLVARGWWGRPEIAKWIWIVGAVVFVVYYAVRPLQRPIYLGWLYAAYPIGWTISHLLLFVVYFVVITPVGLVLRLFGKDPLERRFDADAESYWTARERVEDPRRYFRQF